MKNYTKKQLNEYIDRVLDNAACYYYILFAEPHIVIENDKTYVVAFDTTNLDWVMLTPSGEMLKEYYK